MSGYCFLFFFVSIIPAQTRVLELFKDQVAAYNNRDINRLTENVTDDFIWYSVSSDSSWIEVSNKENFRKAMSDYFASRRFKIKSTIESYHILGNRISFKESVEHRTEDGQIHRSAALGVYQFKNGKIERAWYFVD